MLTIREENNNDIKRITQIEYAAFKDHPMHPPGAEPVEQRIVTRLWETGALIFHRQRLQWMGEACYLSCYSDNSCRAGRT